MGRNSELNQRPAHIGPARERRFDGGRRDSNPRPSPWQGKGFVRLVPARPVKCGSVHSVSSTSTRFAPVVERSTFAWARMPMPLQGRVTTTAHFGFPVSDWLRTVASG